MLLELYLFLFGIGFVLMGLSFFTKIAQKEMILIPFLATAVFAFVAISSFNIETTTCTLDTDCSQDCPSVAWGCHTNVTTDTYTGYFAGGMSALMLIFAIYTSVNAAGEYAVTGRTE